MKQRIIFATGNEGKMREIRAIMAELGMEICSMKEVGANAEIVENGSTFAENARIKAQTIHMCCPNDIVLADDSGLIIDCLGGEPGIYSARYMGEDTPYEQKNANLIARVNASGDRERKARFWCAIAAVLPDGSVLETNGAMEGVIAEGEGGFGYDPILYLPEYQKTSAQLSMEEKNKISHRGKALESMKTELIKVFGEK
mgnify:FL=1